MATLLKSCFLKHGKMCLSQINNSTSILNQIKFGYNKAQVTCPCLIKRFIRTQQSEPPEQLPRMLIYEGSLSNHIKSLKIFSLSTSALGIFGWPLVYFTNTYEFNGNEPPLLLFAGIVIYSLCTPVIMHIFTKRYIKKLEYDGYEDKYIATVYTLMCKEKKIEFKLEDVMRMENPRMFTTVKVRGMPLFFDQYAFKEPEHCSRLLAYDQPIDFKLSEVVDDSDHENESVKKESIKHQNRI